jgi:threonine aldolase
MRAFASDNYSGAHPAIMDAVLRANADHEKAYGYDRVTASAEARFREHFGPQAEAFFVFTGTAANVLGLKAVTQSHHAILCAAESHLNRHECGAPENTLGCKLLTVPARNGKLHPGDLARHLSHVDEHYAQPKVISITQSSELGTVYQPEEIRALAELAHCHGLYLHMDGSRLSNAAASLNMPLRGLTTDAGVDVLSFGGTKNGLMFGEAVVFLNPGLGKNFKFIRKQGMQLGSKMRFLSAQFDALLANDLWRTIASHTNQMARLLAESVRGIPGIEIVGQVESNVVFARVPPRAIAQIDAKYHFYVWNENESIVRWMTCFDTTPEEIREFAATVKGAVEGGPPRSEAPGWMPKAQEAHS